VRPPTAGPRPRPAVGGQTHTGRKSRPKQQAQWDERLDFLAITIRKWADPEAVVPEPQEGRPVFTHELYYDNIKDTVTDEMRDQITSRFKKRKTC
jgi:hypothetical protein